MWCGNLKKILNFLNRILPRLPIAATKVSITVWPDWAIFCTFGYFLKPLAKINLPKSPTFLANFLKVPYSIIFLVKSYLGNFCRHLAIFIWSPGFKYSFKITVNYPPSSSRSFNWISRLISSWKLLVQLSCRKSKLRIKFTSSRNEQTRSSLVFNLVQWKCFNSNCLMIYSNIFNLTPNLS